MASIDRIVIQENGRPKTVTPDQWKALPLPQRVQLLSGGAQFFAGAETVSPKLALAQLR
jgi:hypothetical protein